ncbi:MAG: hypothetical protein KatS3mg008_0872 [Acidimicrobiales bacterium]|nr:MAG: hypothetical protein KatS3mg008_0872 [Acidimicrobiales bacterium]
MFEADERRVERFQGQRTLEIGCGDGMDAIALAKAYGCRVVATDYAWRRVLLASENVAKYGVTHRVDVITADAHRLPFADSTFDGVIGNSVMLFLDHDSACAEVARVLREGGSFVLTNESISTSPLVRLSRNVGLGYRSRELEQHVRERLSPERIERLARTHFSEVEYSLHFGPLLQVRWAVHLVAQRIRSLFSHVDHYFKEDVETPKLLHQADGWLSERSDTYRSWSWIASIRFVK